MSTSQTVKCDILTCKEKTGPQGDIRTAGWISTYGPDGNLIDLCPGHADQLRAFLRGEGSETAFELAQALYRRAARGDEAAYEAFETLRREVDVMTASLGARTGSAMHFADLVHANLQRLARNRRLCAYVGRVMPDVRR